MWKAAMRRWGRGGSRRIASLTRSTTISPARDAPTPGRRRGPEPGRKRRGPPERERVESMRSHRSAAVMDATAPTTRCAVGTEPVDGGDDEAAAPPASTRGPGLCACAGARGRADDDADADEDDEDDEEDPPADDDGQEAREKGSGAGKEDEGAAGNRSCRHAAGVERGPGGDADDVEEDTDVDDEDEEGADDGKAGRTGGPRGRGAADDGEEDAGCAMGAAARGSDEGPGAVGAEEAAEEARARRATCRGAVWAEGVAQDAEAGGSWRTEGVGAGGRHNESLATEARRAASGGEKTSERGEGPGVGPTGGGSGPLASLGGRGCWSSLSAVLVRLVARESSGGSCGRGVHGRTRLGRRVDKNRGWYHGERGCLWAGVRV
jgi:hypothetical protein